MTRRDKAGGKAVKTQRPKTLSRNGAKAARRRSSPGTSKETNVAQVIRERDEALEQLAATSEVLQVISSSPGELEPVFQVMLEKAVRICDANFGNLYLREGNAFRIGVTYGASPAYVEFLRTEQLFHLNPKVGLGRLVRTKEPYHVADISAVPTHGEQLREATIKLAGARTLIALPMLKDNEVVGAIVIYRQEVRPFTDKQIELVKNFAAQAVIAIENTRLFNELHQRTDDLTEALEQQTATSEVLRVISSSPTNVQPVFDAIAESAVRLCDGQFSFVLRFDGKVMDFASCCGLSAEGLDAFHSILPMPASEDTASGRAVVRRAVVEIPDVEADPSYGAQGQDLAKAVTYQSIAAVPLLHEGNPIGAIAVARANAGSFPKRQIVLLQAFADQAVIAIENVRLFDEVQARTRDLTESLQQQTATADVLKVISRSTFDLQIVLDTLTNSAAGLCDADMAAIIRQKGAANYWATSYGFPPEHGEHLKKLPIQPGRGSVAGRVLAEGKTVHVPDVLADPEYSFLEAQRIAGYRTALCVPLLREGSPIGVVALMRRKIQPFTDKQIELAETFADQAVIAIENVRLFDEVQARTEELTESLQQQTATADVLKVISRSTFDLQVVLDTLVESAARLCEADSAAIHRPVGASYPYVASHGLTREYDEYMRERPLVPGRGTVLGRAITELKPIQVDDVTADPEYTLTEARKIGGFRTVLGVPLLREGVPIGIIMLTRNMVRPFTEKQIELVSTFADQAAIAIENVRLFESVEARTRELAKSLEDLRTTQDRLVQTQKLASLGQLTAGIAHEIKNPLNFVNNFSALSAELIDELRQALAPTSTTSYEQRSLRLRILCKATSTRSSSTASAPMPSSRTCFCTRAKARVSIGSSILMPSSRRASISPITGRGPRSRASISH